MFKTDTQTVAIDTDEFVAKYGDKKSFLGFCGNGALRTDYGKGIVIGTKITLDEDLRSKVLTKDEVLCAVGNVVCDYREAIDSMLEAMRDIIPKARLIYPGCCCYGVMCGEKQNLSMDEIGFNLTKIAGDYFGFSQCAKETELPESLFLIAALIFPDNLG